MFSRLGSNGTSFSESINLPKDLNGKYVFIRHLWRMDCGKSCICFKNPVWAEFLPLCQYWLLIKLLFCIFLIGPDIRPVRKCVRHHSVRKWKYVMRFEIRYFFLEVGLSPKGLTQSQEKSI